MEYWTSANVLLGMLKPLSTGYAYSNRLACCNCAISPRPLSLGAQIRLERKHVALLLLIIPHHPSKIQLQVEIYHLMAP